MPNAVAISENEIPIFDLDTLSERIPAIPKGLEEAHALYCKICLDSQGHTNGVLLPIETSYQPSLAQAKVQWQGSLTDRDRRGTLDEKKTTDFGACVLALLFVDQFTEYTAYQQSATGDTIDYHLAPREILPQLLEEETLIFNSPITSPIAYLEVSGIRCQTEHNNINSRVREKRNRLNTPEDLPTLIAVVEFSQPYAKVVKVLQK